MSKASENYTKRCVSLTSMLESLFYIISILTVVIFGLASIILIIIGFIKKSNRLKLLSLILGLITLIVLVANVFWYKVSIPNQNSLTAQEYSGTYYLDGIKSNPKLILKKDLTFQTDTISTLELYGQGTWKTGMVDGLFGFYNNLGQLVGFAYPSYGQLKFNYMQKDQVIFKK